MRVERIGYGAGHRDFPDRPNVLRVLVGEAEAAAAVPARERVTLLTFEIDDMNPQIYGVLIDELLAAGALDVYYTAVQMKKNRPGDPGDGDGPARAPAGAVGDRVPRDDHPRRALP